LLRASLGGGRSESRVSTILSSIRKAAAANAKQRILILNNFKQF
jgi:hypothetical protein